MLSWAFRVVIGFVLCWVGLSAFADERNPPSGADQSATVAAPLSRAQAEQLLATLKDPEQRAHLTTTLEAYVRAMSIAPATKSAAAPPPAAPAKPAEPSSSIERALKALSDNITMAIDHLERTFRSLVDWPALNGWVDSIQSDPNVRTQSVAVATRLALVAALAAALELLLLRMARRSHPSGSAPLGPARSPAGRLRRALRHLLWNLTILSAVAILGNVLVWVTTTEFPVARSVGLRILNTYLAVRLIRSLAESVVAPHAPARRLAHVSDHGARQILLWIRLLAATGAFGFVIGEIAAELGAPPDVHESIHKLAALLVHLLLIVLVIRSRHTVATWLRQRSATSRFLGSAGEALAIVWPYIAVIAIATWWLVWAMDVPNGYERILRFVLATSAVLLSSRLLSKLILSATDRRFEQLASRPGFAARLASYRRIIDSATQVVLIGVTLVVLMQVWGLESLAWFESGHVAHHLSVVALKIVLLGLIGVVCWEAADAAVENRVSRLIEASALARATRLRTVQPIIRVAIIIALGLIFVMTALSEIGINVGPLLAGAGIFGVALGFGSQKLVQDFITGIFLLVEDAVDVGDWVTVAGLSGSVENLSIRTIRLRAGDGSVHLIPFSAVTSVTNTNRGVGNAAVSVNVAPTEDTDRVSAVLADIVREMRQDPAFAVAMRSDLQLWGVDKVDGGMITIVGQIVCTDAGRWAVQREFNRRLKKRLEEEEIALAVPQEHVRIERIHRKISRRAASDSPDESSAIRKN
jgi:small-conductance mechanosensitive channel